MGNLVLIPSTILLGFVELASTSPQVQVTAVAMLFLPQVELNNFSWQKFYVVMLPLLLSQIPHSDYLL